MTQKSVSIRANVSIRGVTIRAYALYHISVTENFINEFVKQKLIIKDTGAAWRIAVKKFESGLGIEFAYFLSKVDSKLLYSAYEIYIDATFAPTSGIKHLYPKLQIFSIRTRFRPRTILGIPCAFGLTTSKTEANYKLMLKAIKDFADLADDGPEEIYRHFKKKSDDKCLYFCFSSCAN